MLRCPNPPLIGTIGCEGLVSDQVSCLCERFAVIVLEWDWELGARF
jgi:hypothetical protein